MKDSLSYEKDFYAWAMHNAELIKEGRLTEADAEHIAEELESMGRSDKRELMSRFAILLAHLLKWQFQPERRGNSWKYTIEEQRLEIIDLLDESPSLKSELEKKVGMAYQKALLMAIKETGLSKNVFPVDCPFSLEQAIKREYLPS